MKSDQIKKLMKLTQSEAEKAIKSGNAPFGTVAINKRGEIIVQSHNTVNSDMDPTAHAEINLLRKLAKKLKIVKFKNIFVFINSEPCSMCASALIRSGIRDIYYGSEQEDAQVLKIPLSLIAKKSKVKINITKGLFKDECLKQIKHGRAAIKL
ncbi:MAG: nucleoside deaminase [Candidatus Falkowbacteria bacterium]|nr:nucleoside deaminase [Candidatus Falkowbacteria bacterium]